MARKPLFDKFPPVSAAKWMEKITTDLKGADFSKRLVWKTNEGFNVMPLYRRDDLIRIGHSLDLLPLISVENTHNPEKEEVRLCNNWLVRQDIVVKNYREANLKALSILKKGIDSLGFIIADPETITEKNFDTLLGGINPEFTEINFISDGRAKEIIDLISRESGRRGFDPDKIAGAMEADPLGRLTVNGTLCIPVEEGFKYLMSLTKGASVLQNYRCIQVNGSNFTNAGASSVQELAFSLSMANDYITMLSESGLDPAYIAGKIRFSFGIGTGYFMEIAKLRAARLLWSVISKGFDRQGSKQWRMQIHCTTSKWNSAIYDPYVNMLRSQTEAMSAVLGGTDSLTVNPFDSSFRQAGEFSERIARNQQLILKEEAYFNKVADPAAGSYYIENLTSLVAESAWKLFLETEEAGGFLATLRSGMVQKRIKETAEKRRSDVALRREILLGTNQYPDLTETISSGRYQIFSPPDSSVNKLEVEPLQMARGSEELERIRISVDRSPVRPSVFLLKIGNHVMRKARAQFSSGFFGCAGYRIIDPDPYDDVDEGVRNALESKAEIVVICSSDEEYQALAPEIHRKLEGSAIAVVAGNPECIEFLKRNGLENYIHVRSDLTSALRYFNQKTGVKEYTE